MDIVLVAFVASATFALGFVIRRGSVCMVEASHQLVVKGRSLRLRSFAIAAGAATLVLVPASLAMSQSVSFYSSTDIDLRLVLAATGFALGARLNGGCAFGTLTQLSVGKIEYLGTIAGAVVGALVLGRASFGGLQPSPLHTPGWHSLALLLLGFALISPALKRSTLGNIRSLIRSRRALLRPTTAMLLLGLLGSAVFSLAQSWTYLAVLADEAAFLTGAMASHGDLRAIAGAAALIAGAVFAAIRSGRFRLVRPRPTGLVKKLLAGAVMGAAAANIPGGNGALLLFGMPLLSISALVAYAIITLVLVLSFVPVRLARRSP